MSIIFLRSNPVKKAGPFVHEVSQGNVRIERGSREILAGRERVAVVVNYDNCSILPPLIDDYSAMVKRLSERFYSRVTRYGTGGFLKAKLEAAPAPV